MSLRATTPYHYIARTTPPHGTLYVSSENGRRARNRDEYIPTAPRAFLGSVGMQLEFRGKYVVRCDARLGAVVQPSSSDSTNGSLCCKRQDVIVFTQRETNGLKVC